jgi:hypothetical protein
MQTNIQIKDVVVVIIGYRRPDLLANRFNEIEKCGVLNLFLSIDGGQDSQTIEMNSIKQDALKRFSKINFKLTHHSENLGLSNHIITSIDTAFSTNKYMILIEDDVVISANFLDTMLRGFNLQKQLNVKGIVSGYSPNFNNFYRNKWRKTHIAYLWGWGCSSEVWKNYTPDLSSIDLERNLMDSQTWLSLNKFQKKFWMRKFLFVSQNPSHTWDYQFNYHSFVNNFVNLSPVFSIVSNEGFNDTRATHTIGKRPKNLVNGELSTKDIVQLTKFSMIYSFFDFDNCITGLNQRISKIFRRRFQQYP